MSRPPGVDPRHRSSKLGNPGRNKKEFSWAYPKFDSPGKYDEINAESKGILSVDVADGFRFALQSSHAGKPKNEPDKTKPPQPSSSYQATHVISMPSRDEPANYTFMSGYADEFFEINGRVNTEGVVTGKFATKDTALPLMKMPFVSRITDGNLNFTGEGQSGEQQTFMIFGAEYAGADFTCGVKHIFPLNLYQFDYMQALTNTLCAGFQTQFQKSQFAGTSLAGKYSTKRSSTSFVLNPYQATLEGHHHRNLMQTQGMKLTLGTDFTIQPVQATQSIQSSWGIGYALMKQTTRTPTMVKGRIDSSGKVSCSLDDFLLDTIKISIGGELDHSEKKYKFGVSLEAGI